ncbi:MAG: energy-coupling factor transporter ATPase [Clostridiales bacterium]|nr:energy-coupling factor transporter ATPase [Candidatus Equinaster intestinalis]
MSKIIETKNLCFGFDTDSGKRNIIENMNISFEKGSFNVILGHNGSGKSTFAKLMNGLLKPDSGEVLVNGISTADSEKELEIRRTVGLIFQNPDNQLIASVVEEDVAFGPENLGIEPDIIRKRVEDALKSVDMLKFRKSSPNNLSGGQKQRVAIAGILAMQPECIILDESTAMLDPKGRKEVFDTVYKLNRENNITVIWITHFMNEAEKADRVLVMNSGEFIADGAPKEIFSEVEKLRSLGLDIPQTTELLYELNINGMKNDFNCISIEETVAELEKLLS